MARTEKKFGHAKNLAGGTTLTELVPTSANRRNILLNMTSTASDTVTAIVSSGNLVSSPVGTPVSAMSTTKTNFLSGSLTNGIEYGTGGSSMYGGGHCINRSKTRIVGCPDGPGNGYMYYANIDSTGAISTSGKPSVGGGSYNLNFYNNGYFSDLPPQRTSGVVSFGTGSNEAVIFCMGWPRGGVISTSTSYAQFHIQYGSAPYGNVYNYPYVSGAGASHYTYVYGVVDLKHPTVNNVLVIGGAGPSYGSAPYLEVGEFSGDGVKGYMYTSGLSGQLGIANNEAVYSMFPIDYNTSTGQFAISTPGTVVLGVNGASLSTYPTVSGATIPSWPTGANAHPGFRIVQEATSGDTLVERILNGTITYPPAPTGVNVPVNVEPVRALKFSPDGNKLVVFYNRSYSGSGNTNSVVVLYEKGANNTWSHTWSSGSSVANTVSKADAIDWSSDSSMICFIESGNTVRMLSFGVGAGSANNVITISGGAPTLNSGTISAVNHASGLFTGSITMTTSPVKINSIPTTNGTNKFIVFQANANKYLLQQGDLIAAVTGQTTGTGSVGNYVGTVAQNVPVASGNVTQIGGIVLEAGEKLSVQATTGSRADVAAYGVEIS